ncbi:MAG TPA: histidine kinase [Caulobacter sp.]|nr:histidine kinase [Caulobacter sp.]
MFLWPLRTASPAIVALDLACVAAFLPLYVLAHWLSPLRALAPIGGIAVLGVVAMPGNPGASVLFTYAACLACLTQPAARGVAVAGLVVAVFAGMAVLVGRGPGYILIDGFVTAVVCAIYLQVRRGDLIREGLARREEEVVELARIAERERIAIDLHDLFGQTFALITVKAELTAGLLADDPSKAREELEALAAVAREGLGRARETLHGWTGGLDAEIKAARTLLEAAGVALTVERSALAVPAMADGLMALILRESVTNIVRHARAGACAIRLTQDATGTTLLIADDGRGALRYEGKGVRGMADRAARLGAKFEIVRRSGTQVRLVLPREAEQ